MSIYPRRGMTLNMWPDYITLGDIPEGCSKVKMHVTSTREANVIKDAFEAICNMMNAGTIYAVYCTPYFKIQDTFQDGVLAREDHFLMTIKWMPVKIQDVNVNIDQED